MTSKWSIPVKANSVDELRQILLSKRGILDSQENFFGDEDPLLFLRLLPPDFKLGLKKAKDLINEAISKDLPIVIMGDYDADGICATSVLFNFFAWELKYKKAFYFIPNRFEHGYGLSMDSINTAISKVEKEGIDASKILFISVDSGITSIKETEYIKKLGHDLIITDHHQKSLVVPSPDVLVWTDKIVGTAISWVLSKVLGSKNQSSIALVALATVTDVYPLLGMNRSLVKKGLKIINQNPPAGLKELIQVSNLRVKEISSYELGWILGPKINASGRLADASIAVKLLTSGDSQQREQIASELNRINFARQAETSRVYELLSHFDSQTRFILMSQENLHEGIIGLVAGKLAKQNYKPSIVISKNGKSGKGSARSIPGVNIISVLREFEDLFENLGGHPMAAGFTIPLEKIPELEKNLTEVFEKEFSADIFTPSLDIEAEIPFNLVDFPLLDLLEEFKPYGEGNPSPKFETPKLGIAGMDFVGKEENHTSLRLFDGEKYQRAIYFNSRPILEKFNIGDYIDAVYSVKPDEYNGQRNPGVIIEEIHPSS